MNKRRPGTDGESCSKKRDPCPKKHRYGEGADLSPKDIPRGALGVRLVRRYYDSSGTIKLIRLYKDELFGLTQLAMWTYNLKEDTNFDNVKVLRAKSLILSGNYYYVTFQAFSPQGVATTFQTKIHYFCPIECSKIEFVFVRIVPDDSHSDSDDFNIKPKNYRPSIGHPKERPYRKRLEAQINDPHSQLPVSLSKYALINYNLAHLHVTTARHDFQSLKIVKPMECITKKTTYLLTFQASLRDDSKKVETFQTELHIPTLFPTTIIEFWDYKKMD